MKLKQALNLAAEKLAALKDIDAPTFEAEVLLRHVLNINRAALHLKLIQEISVEQSLHFFRLVERRLHGEPTSYILHQREFYGLDFYVDKRVLIPRPETELLVEEALKFIKNHTVKSIADIGTGSGAIAVSLVVNLFKPSLQPDNQKETMPFSSLRASQSPEAICPNIFAVDISNDALEVARTNAQRLGVADQINFLQGDLLTPLPQPVDIIIANLPYVTAGDVKAMPSAQYEPQLALNGGNTGLELIFRLIDQIKGRVNQGGCVLLEIGMGQARAVTDYLGWILPEAAIEVLPDLAGIERVMRVEMITQKAKVKSQK